MLGDDVSMVKCPRCQGFGEREIVFYVHWPVEYQGGDGCVEVCECEFCGGKGKVTELEASIISEDPNE